MRGFHYDTFVDLSPIFIGRGRRQVKPPEAEVRLTLHAVEGIQPALPVSRFTNLKIFRPLVQSRFIPVITQDNVAPAVEQPKTRGTLKLKTKVELPAMAPISRKSTLTDLAVVFKTELKQLEKNPAKELSPATAEKRRHPLSHKTWAELIAEAEAPKKTRHNIDLAAAFKAEMQTLLAEQKKAEEFTPAVTPVRLKAAFEPRIVRSQPLPAFRPRPAVKVRILAA